MAQPNTPKVLLNLAYQEIYGDTSVDTKGNIGLAVIRPKCEHGKLRRGHKRNTLTTRGTRPNAFHVTVNELTSSMER
jgi:hypothetical protein